MIDPKEIERIGPNYWRNSQLSVAKYYGGIYIGGHRYTLDPLTDELVRGDVYRREQRERQEADKQAKEAAKARAAEDQGRLF